MDFKNSFTTKPSVKLSPPWYVLLNKLRATIGADKSIEIEMYDETEYSKIIKITAEALWKAEALACILIPEYEFGNMKVSIELFYKEGCKKIQAPDLPEGLPANIAGLIVINRALQDNPFFYLAFPPCILGEEEENKKSLGELELKDIKSEVLPWEANIVIVFKRLVVQYYTDNIGDFFLNNNEVASMAFKEVMNEILFEECKLTFTENPDIGKEF